MTLPDPTGVGGTGRGATGTATGAGAVGTFTGVGTDITGAGATGVGPDITGAGATGVGAGAPGAGATGPFTTVKREHWSGDKRMSCTSILF